MKIKFYCCLLWIVMSIFSREVKAQYPYIQSFKDNEAPSMIFGGTPNSSLLTSPLIDPIGEGALRLTNANNEQTGFVYNNRILPTTFGMDVEFEYFIYGGSGADGLTFFLFDANTTQFRVGQFGGSMGYAHNCNGPGISNAYLGVGFDAFGNFSGSNECRSGQSTGSGSVVLRGAGNGQTPQDYPQIISVNTSQLPVSPFPLTEGSARATDSNMPGYRKAFITIRPLKVGFSIVIKIQHGTVISEVLSDSITTPPPSDFKFGFTASTGGSTNFHEVRNLSISIPGNIVLTNPLAENDIFPPVCSNDSLSYNILANDTTKNLGGTLLASGIDLDTIASGIQDTLVIPSVGKFSVIGNLGDIRFVPISTFSTTFTVPYKVTDSYGKLSNGATFTVSGRQAPFLTSGLSKTIVSGESVNLELAVTPTINDVTYTYPTPIASGGVLGGMSRTTATGSRIDDILTSPTRTAQTVTYNITPVGNSCNGNATPVIITVTNGNTEPSTRTDTLKTVKNNVGSVDVRANDSDFNGDALTTTVVITSKNGFSVLSSSGNLQYTPNTGFSGIDTLHYQTCDAPAPSLCTRGVVIIRVRDNKPPIIVADAFYTTLQRRVIGNVKTNDSDPDGDLFGPSAVTNVPTEKNGTITMSATGNFTYTPAVGFVGQDTYSYQECDAYNECVSTTLVIIVMPNLPPVAVKDSINTTMNKSVVFMPLNNDSDPEKDTLSLQNISGVTAKGGSVIRTRSRVFTYTPPVGFIGVDTFIYTVCDSLRPQPNCSNGTIVINVVEPLNLPPIVMQDSAFTTKNVPVSINPASNDNDPEDTALKVSVGNTTTQNGGTVNSDGTNILTYTPPLNYIGRDSYQYTVCDAQNKCSNATITFIVGPTPNVRPVANDDSVSTLENTSVDIYPLLNDTDSDGELLNSTLSASSPKHGTLTVNLTNGSFLYVPNKDYIGIDTIYYTICDNGQPSLCDDAAVKVTVVAKPTIPLFIPEGFSPNGDLVNQQFVIEGIEKSKVALIVFNRWGDKVYESSNYKNDWEGNSNHGVTIGQNLPDGTYFINVEIDNSAARFTKYITISR